MSRNTSDGSKPTGYRRDIREAWKDAAANIAELERTDAPTGHQKRKTAVALNTFRKMLRPHKDEDVLDEPWDERGVDVVADWATAKTQIERRLDRRGSPVETVTAPMAYDVSVREFDRVFNELQAIATELGWYAKPRDVTPHTQGDEEDLVGLLKARGQEQALDNLPARFRSDDDGDE